MPSHTDEERARNRARTRAAKAADAARNRAADAERNRAADAERAKNKKKPGGLTRNPLMRALRGAFGFGVEGTSRALERAEDVFIRTAKKVEEEQRRRR